MIHILAITPGTGFRPQSWELVLGAGVDGFLLREPDLEARALLEAARWCRARFPQTPVWVGGRLDVALASGCGLHAPEAYPDDLGPSLPLSRPLHTESQWPVRQSAHQVLVAPVFEVPGKGPPWGIQRLHAFLDGCPEAGPRILALGGVTLDRMKALQHPRLSGVALMRSLWEAPDPGRLISRLRESWHE